MLQQALRDLSAWAERDIAPPATTNYNVVDGQVVVPPAKEYKGVQTVIELKTNGSKRVNSSVGEVIRYTVEGLKALAK